MPDSFTLHDLRAVEARVEPFDWSFVAQHAAEIERVWMAETGAKPGMFDGEVLIQHRGEVAGDVFRAAYGFTRYKAFLAWNRLGCPGIPVRNGFAMAALQSREGAYLLGVMAEGTANAGKIYFAAGTPDRNDVTAEGEVDLAGSVIRELEEETGLSSRDVVIEPRWRAVMGRHRVAFMRPVRLDLPADEARRMILDRMRALPEQELSDIVIARDARDIDPTRMPPFQRAFLEDAFGLPRQG